MSLNVREDGVAFETLNTLACVMETIPGGARGECDVEARLGVGADGGGGGGDSGVEACVFPGDTERCKECKLLLNRRKDWW
mgnify:CR=1 FL=1